MLDVNNAQQKKRADAEMASDRVGAEHGNFDQGSYRQDGGLDGTATRTVKTGPPDKKGRHQGGSRPSQSGK